MFITFFLFVCFCFCFCFIYIYIRTMKWETVGNVGCSPLTVISSNRNPHANLNQATITNKKEKQKQKSPVILLALSSQLFKVNLLFGTPCHLQPFFLSSDRRIILVQDWRWTQPQPLWLDLLWLSIALQAPLPDRFFWLPMPLIFYVSLPNLASLSRLKYKFRDGKSVV